MTSNSIYAFLDNKRGAISGGALKRNGEVAQEEKINIWFEQEISVNNRDEITLTSAPANCRYCSDGTPWSLHGFVVRDPFSKSDSYEIPIRDTHEQIACPTCGKSKKVVCTDCNGNGRVRCENCKGDGRVVVDSSCEHCQLLESPDPDCAQCGGRGYVQHQIACRDCEGYGHEECGLCHGTGVMDCSHCLGEGLLHQFDGYRVSLDRTVNARQFPREWSNYHHSIAHRISWSEEDLQFKQSESSTIAFRTRPLRGEFYRVKYGSSAYRCAVLSNQSGGPDLVWDPSTGYPETNFRRKLGDLKSRLLW